MTSVDDRHDEDRRRRRHCRPPRRARSRSLGTRSACPPSGPRTSGRRCAGWAGCSSSERADARAGGRGRRSRRGAQRVRPAGARPRHRPHRRRASPAAGINFSKLHTVLLRGGRPLRRLGPAVAGWPPTLLAGVVQRLMYRLRRAVEDKIHALPLSYIDQRVARRPAEPGDQRHRQHRPEPPADPEPDAQLDPAARRRGRHDVHDLAAAGAWWRSPPCPCRCSACARSAARARPRYISQWRATGALNSHRRGDLHRARHREVVRPPARGRGALPGAERRAVRVVLRRPVHVEPDAAGHHVPEQRPVRARRRGRRAAGGQRGHQRRRHPGLHPVLADVLDAAHPAGLDDEHLPVRDRLARAGLRVPRRRRAERRSAGRPAAGGDTGRVAFEDVTLLLRPRPAADRVAVAGGRAGPDHRHRRARPARARPRWST